MLSHELVGTWDECCFLKKNTGGSLGQNEIKWNEMRTCLRYYLCIEFMYVCGYGVIIVWSWGWNKLRWRSRGWWECEWYVWLCKSFEEKWMCDSSIDRGGESTVEIMKWLCRGWLSENVKMKVGWEMDRLS